jgi:hypothetical protein
MSATANDNLIYIDQRGELACVSPKAIAEISEQFNDVLVALSIDLQVALDCLHIWGGIPIPVAKAILRNIEPAHAAIDMAIRSSPAKPLSIVHYPLSTVSDSKGAN